MKEEKDLGVVTQENIKIKKQVVSVELIANRMVCMIRRSLVNCEEKIMVKLYKTYVRPHVGFAIVAWSTHKVKDVSNLERVQNRFTRMIPTVKDIPYEQRERSDIIETYKIIHGHTKMNSKDLFQCADENTDATRLRIYS